MNAKASNANPQSQTTGTKFETNRMGIKYEGQTNYYQNPNVKIAHINGHKQNKQETEIDRLH